MGGKVDLLMLGQVLVCPRPRHSFEQAAWRPAGAARRGRAGLSYSVLGAHPTADLSAMRTLPAGPYRRP